MYSGKTKPQAKRTVAIGQRLVPLSPGELNETVGGRAATPDMSDTGDNLNDARRRALRYEQG